MGIGIVRGGQRRYGERLRPATVSVIVPALNEAESIGWVLERIPEWVTEVILVDGRSTDATEIVASHLVPNLVVVHQPQLGKGAALRAGFAAASGEIVAMLDADGSTNPEELGRFVRALEHGADFVKGSRNLPGGGSEDFTLLRKTGNRGLVRLTNLVYGCQFTDLCYGYCAFWRHHLPALRLLADGFEIETELALRAVKTGLKIEEVPSVELNRRAGVSNLHAYRDGRRVLRTIIDERPGLSGRRPIIRTRIDLTPVMLPLPGSQDWLPAGIEKDRRSRGRAASGYTGPERRRADRQKQQRVATVYRASERRVPRELLAGLRRRMTSGFEDRARQAVLATPTLVAIVSSPNTFTADQTLHAAGAGTLRTLIFAGKGGAADHQISASSATFAGTVDPGLYIGYNQTGNGTRPNAAEIGWSLGIEGNYNDGSGHNKAEVYFQYPSADGTINRRPIMLQMDKVTNKNSQFSMSAPIFSWIAGDDVGGSGGTTAMVFTASTSGGSNGILDFKSQGNNFELDVNGNAIMHLYSTPLGAAGAGIYVGTTPGGDNSAVATFEVGTSNTGVKGLVVRGRASQAANLLEIESSTNAVLLSVSSDGKTLATHAGAVDIAQSTNRMYVGDLTPIIGGSPGIVFGSALDTNLYLTASKRLVTNGGIGQWGVTGPSAKPASPGTAAGTDAVVINATKTILESYGMCA